MVLSPDMGCAVLVETMSMSGATLQTKRRIYPHKSGNTKAVMEMPKNSFWCMDQVRIPSHYAQQRSARVLVQPLICRPAHSATHTTNGGYGAVAFTMGFV